MSHPVVCCALLLAGASVSATAQSTSPLDPAQRSTTPPYRSVFDTTPAFKPEKAQNWRAQNDTVSALAGHNAHLRDIAKTVMLLGTVVDLDPAKRIARLEHEKIEALGWPAGSAFWPVADAALLQRLNPGDRVAFTLELQGDAYAITKLAPASGTKP